MQEKYTHPMIKGVPYTTMLPEGCALVLEGGGTRGFYTSGVFEAFMEEGIMFPYIIGVSAGAANALTYISGQHGRNRQIIEHYVGSHEYVGYKNLIKHGTMFGYNFIFHEIPEKHVYWDSRTFKKAKVKFLTGALDCITGKTIWFQKQDLKKKLRAVQASCSVPFISKIVKYRGHHLLDGGIVSPIPIDKSIKDGNKFHVVVLTRNQGYIKPPFKNKVLLNLIYRKYPKLRKVMLNRHNEYNRQLALCEQLEKKGKAIIIRPIKQLETERTETNIEKLLRLHDEGYEEGKAVIGKILSKCK